MKKNLLGLLAIVLAIGFSAFSSKKTAFIYYEYVPAVAGDFSQTSVQVEARWFLRATAPCEQVANEKACTIGVDAAKLEVDDAATLEAADTNNNIHVIADATTVAAVTDVLEGANSTAPDIRNIEE